MQKRAAFAIRHCRIVRLRALGGGNAAGESPTKGNARSHHADRRAQFRLRGDLGGRAAQIFRAGRRARQDHAGAERLGLFERGGRPLNQFLRVHVRGTRPGASRRRAGDRDSSAQPHHDVGRRLRKAIVDKLGLTRESPIGERLKALTQLGTIGATGPGAASEQIIKFLVKKAGGIGTILKFVYIGAPELPASLMNDVIDAYALSPPSAEITEASGKGYVLIPLGKGEVTGIDRLPL